MGAVGGEGVGVKESLGWSGAGRTPLDGCSVSAVPIWGTHGNYRHTAAIVAASPLVRRQQVDEESEVAAPGEQLRGDRAGVGLGDG